MSTSAEGILFWGVHYGADDLEKWFPEDATGDSGHSLLANRAWELEQQQRPPEPPLGPPNSEYDTPAWDEWRQRVARIESAGCDLRRAGHYDSSQASYVYVRASRQRAEWSEVVPIASLAVPPEWRASLLAYLEALGLPPREPGWFLTSYYG